MRIRTRLFSLALAIVLPGMLGAMWGLYVLYQQQKEAASDNLLEITRGVAAVVEREIALRQSMLQTLAVSPTLQDGDLKTFYHYAKAATPTNDRTIVLIGLDHQQLLNTRVPFGAPLPQSTAFRELRAKATPEEDLVSDLYAAPVGERQSFAVQVPVWRGGKVVAYLAMGNHAESLQKALEDQRLPPRWNAAVIDRKGIIVARRISPRHINKRVLESLAAAGAFDCLEPRRARAFNAVDAMLAQSQRAGANAASGQMDMLGGIGVKPTLHVQEVEEWLPAELPGPLLSMKSLKVRPARSTCS